VRFEQGGKAAEGLSPMGNPVFFGGNGFAEGLAKRGAVEDRIVAEAVITPRLLGDVAENVFLDGGGDPASNRQ